MILKDYTKTPFINFVCKYFILVCPEGYYGDHCMEPCQCPNENFVCHSVTGCICKHEWSGPNCTERNILGQVFKQEPTQNSASIVAGVLVSLLVLVTIVGILLYYRRRISNLKTEIAHVHYIAETQHTSNGNVIFLYISILTY